MKGYISERQAYIYCLYSAGVPVTKIAKQLKASVRVTNQHLAAAQAKARALGFYIGRHVPPAATVGSGMTIAKQLALEAGLI